MSAEPACETYTPCFDWVIQATGSQPTALTYGVVWRYAQMAGARCYASCERLAGHLAWTRQSVMRHLHRLLQLGLVVCANPDVPGVTREYLPVSRERWMAKQGPAASAVATNETPAPVTADAGEQVALPAARETAASQAPSCTVLAGEPVPTADTPADFLLVEAVPSADTPCDLLVQGPVPTGNTRNTIRNTKKKQSGTPADRRDPRIVLLRKLTGRVPPAILREQVLSALGPSPAPERLTGCYRAWCSRGYNPMNYAWLFDWYVRGRVPPPRSGGPESSRTGAAATADLATDAASPGDLAPASVATGDLAAFARWHAYLQAIQEGEQPDEVRRRLNL